MNICQWTESWARLQPDKTALVFDESKISYSEFNKRIRVTATFLKQNFAVREGERIAFLGENSPTMLVLLLACARLGAIFVPLNLRLEVPEYAYVLKDSGAKLLFCDERYLETGKSASHSAGDITISVIGKQFEEASDGLAEESGKIHEGSAAPLLIVYTSGTTGRPKGAVLSHEAIICNAKNSVFMHQMTKDDIIFTNLPMYHVGGLNVQTIPAFSVGATVILHPRFDVEATIRVINESEPTLMVLVPTLMDAVMQNGAWADLDFSSLRAVTTGSTMVPISLLDAYLKRGVPVIQLYGSTETGPIAIHQIIEEAWTSRGSTGRPAIMCDIRIVNELGADLGVDQKGEIMVRGGNLFSCYWNNMEGTREVVTEEWFHTGDIGHIDRNGLYFVDGRAKDVIISGSENIYPAELERILDLSNELAEFTVVGKPDEKWGEVPVVFAVPMEGADVTRESIERLFVGRIARFKHPHDVVFLSSLPRNPMGKVLKYKLTEMLQ